MVDILCTNDDGYTAIGFLPLVRRLAESYTVAVVAPSGPRSWVGKSITAHEPLQLTETELGGVPMWILTGSPADCVQVALYEVLSQRPRLVVSGINIGVNVGYARILSSGTVGAAIEAAIDGVPAVAASLEVSPWRHTHDFFDPDNYEIFEGAAAVTAGIVDRLLRTPWTPDVHVVNVNVPSYATAETELEVTRPFVERYGRLFERSGDDIQHLNPALPAPGVAPDGTDLAALQAGRVSVSPLNLGLVAAGTESGLREALSLTSAP